MTPEPTTTPQEPQGTQEPQETCQQVQAASATATCEAPAAPTPARPRRGAKIALAVVGVVVLLAAVFGIALWAFVNSGASSMKDGATQQGAAANQAASQTAGVDAVEFEGRTYVSNNNVVSILVLGLDDESGDYYARLGVTRPEASCSDANLLVAVDTESGDVTVVAIPRDSEVDVDLYSNGEKTATKPLQLCLAYSTDCGSADACAANAALSVSRLLGGIAVDRFFTLDMEAFKDATTKMGGVTLTALEDVPTANVYAGQEVTLSGDAAYRYVLERTHDWNGANIRLERQRQFLYAFVSQLRSRSAGEILDVYNSVQGKTNTNLQASEIAWLASVLASSQGTFESVTLSGEVRELEDADGELREHVFLDETNIKRIMLGIFYQEVE